MSYRPAEKEDFQDAHKVVQLGDVGFGKKHAFVATIEPRPGYLLACWRDGDPDDEPCIERVYDNRDEAVDAYIKFVFVHF